jgi:hypothetical protein
VRKLTAFVTLALAVALAGSALAREKKERKERAKPERIAGVCASASLEAGTVSLKVTVDNEGEKTVEMPANVVVMYSEKGGQKRVRTIRTAGKKAPEAKGNMQVVQGEITKAEKQGTSLAITVKTADGDQQFELPDKLTIMAREDDGKLKARGIAPGRRGGKKGGGRERRRKKDPANPPENL